MIVCICNAINERQVKAAIESGADNWRAVLAHYGCGPECGQCQLEIVELIAKNQDIAK